MNHPRVSVIIPVYNREQLIQHAVDSALAQTYDNCEIIVIDDGSTDNTAACLAGYGSRISYMRQENAGPSAARNRGVALSRGEILAFLDSDDTWSVDKIAKQLELLSRGGERVPCCICNASIRSKSEDELNSFDLAGVRTDLAAGFWLNPDEIVASRFILFNQVVSVRKSAFEQVGGFREGLHLLEDYDLALRLSLLGPWAFTTEALVQKYNDEEGIGVRAMSEENAHATAWREVLEGFLLENPNAKPAFRHSLASTLRDVRLWVVALHLLELGGLRGFAGHLILSYSRCCKAFNRRLPSWPQPRVAVVLD